MGRGRDGPLLASAGTLPPSVEAEDMTVQTRPLKLWQTPLGRSLQQGPETPKMAGNGSVSVLGRFCRLEADGHWACLGSLRLQLVAGSRALVVRCLNRPTHGRRVAQT
jgi:hypothetical protein